MLVRPPPADDVSYDAVAVQLDESAEQQSLSGHTANTSRLVIRYSPYCQYSCSVLAVYIFDNFNIVTGYRL